MIGRGLGLGLGRFVAWGGGDKVAMMMMMRGRAVGVRRRLVKAWFVVPAGREISGHLGRVVIAEMEMIKGLILIPRLR